MDSTCAIIAGGGSFPLHVASEARRQGLKVVGIGLSGWVDPTLAGHVDAYEEVAVGQLGRLVERLKAHRTTQAIMAGKVTKEVLFDPRVRFDADALGILSRVKDVSVNGLLGAIAERLAKDGIQLLDSSTFLKANLCPAGILTRRQPTAEEQEDIRLGMRAARQLAELDIGQTVVVKQRVIVAAEALEGTDAAITRAGQLVPRASRLPSVAGGLVIVKVASPKQDMRFDLPILGPQTIAVAAAAGAVCVAVESHKTILLDKAAVIARADEAGLSLVGVSAESARLPRDMRGGQGCASGAESASV